uniref:BZIP domain-containing protein n=1 Tax=Tetradesmus obliquus TaxID=3088 RepID=A0A383VQZ2_TETOB|eukprot:jgi/Sobl393_1/13517/SZX67192.1
MSDIISSAAYKPQAAEQEQQLQQQQQHLQPGVDELEDVQSPLQDAAPSEQLRCQAIHQQLLLQNFLRTYGQAGAQPAVSVALRSAVREAGISTANGNYLAIIQSLNGQVLPALSPQFIAAQPVSGQAVLALQQQPQPDPDNPTQLAALLAAMDESSARHIPTRTALQALGIVGGKVSKVHGAAASHVAASASHAAVAAAVAAGGDAAAAAEETAAVPTADPASATVSAAATAAAVSDGGIEVRCGGHATTREKNRQAQQRFRQRQKDRIHELESENRALQEQLAQRNQQLADATREVLLLRSQLEGHGQLLDTAQQQQQQQQQEEEQDEPEEAEEQRQQQQEEQEAVLQVDS